MIPRTDRMQEETGKQSMLTKIIDHIEYTQTEDGWMSRKIHDSGGSIMAHKIGDGEIEAIQAGKRPAWTIIGLPRIIVNDALFKETDEQ